MNQTEGPMFIVMVILSIIAFIVTVMWIFLPLLICSKLNKLIELQEQANERLEAGNNQRSTILDLTQDSNAALRGQPTP